MSDMDEAREGGKTIEKLWKIKDNKEVSDDNKKLLVDEAQVEGK